MGWTFIASPEYSSKPDLDQGKEKKRSSTHLESLYQWYKNWTFICSNLLVKNGLMGRHFYYGQVFTEAFSIQIDKSQSFSWVLITSFIEIFFLSLKDAVRAAFVLPLARQLTCQHLKDASFLPPLSTFYVTQSKALEGLDRAEL